MRNAANGHAVQKAMSAIGCCGQSIAVACLAEGRRLWRGTRHDSELAIRRHSVDHMTCRPQPAGTITPRDSSDSAQSAPLSRYRGAAHPA
jgi:hypothetical protein